MARVPLDLTNQKFGMLTVISEVEPVWYYGQPHRRYYCVCECGNETIVHQGSLRSGNTRSCGCLQRISCKGNGGSKYRGKGYKAMMMAGLVNKI